MMDLDSSMKVEASLSQQPKAAKKFRVDLSPIVFPAVLHEI
jgi:hypothetical protein